MEVRCARLDDAERIAEIHVRAWQAAYHGLMPDTFLDDLSISRRQKFWEERIAQKGATVLVAVSEGLVGGWLVYGRSRDPDATATVAEVHGLYVDPTSWRRGTGTLLWNEARARLTQAGSEYVTLWVIEANTRARLFYEAMGFQQDLGQVKRLEWGGAPISEVRYRTSLR